MPVAGDVPVVMYYMLVSIRVFEILLFLVLLFFRFNLLFCHFFVLSVL